MPSHKIHLYLTTVAFVNNAHPEQLGYKNCVSTRAKVTELVAERTAR